MDRQEEIRLFERLGRIEERLRSIEEKLDNMKESHDNHEDRIDILEKWNVRITAIAATIGALASWVVQWIMKKYS